MESITEAPRPTPSLGKTIANAERHADRLGGLLRRLNALCEVVGYPAPEKSSAEPLEPGVGLHALANCQHGHDSLADDIDTAVIQLEGVFLPQEGSGARG